MGAGILARLDRPPAPSRPGPKPGKAGAPAARSTNPPLQKGMEGVAGWQLTRSWTPYYTPGGALFHPRHPGPTGPPPRGLTPQVWVAGKNRRYGYLEDFIARQDA